MAESSEQGGRRGLFFAAAATALLTALAATLLVLSFDTSHGPGASTVDSPAPTSSSSAPNPPLDEPPAPTGATRSTARGGGNTWDFGSFLPGSRPVGLDIPRIDVHSTDIVDLGLQDDGSIEVPRDASAPGWFTPGPAPGQLGPAVIAGHVDSATGPAVFYRLGQLRPDDRVDVTRADGTVATFSIDRIVTYEKDAFPTRAVYGPTQRAELRLITCSGDYDEDTGYDSNTVAFAHLT